jgi:ATP/maltotriose-dependent transcriptional regulator MalT/DNA-binding SARP family transcriptional activator
MPKRQDGPMRRPSAGLPSARSVASSGSPAHGEIWSETRGPQDQDDRPGSSIIRSKVQPPPVRAETLARPRLLDWLTTHSSDRVKLIVAEAGYGKTTLLADYARRTLSRCVWLRLEETDRDGWSFMTYLVASIREILPDFAPGTTSMLSQMAALSPSMDVVLGTLVSELGKLGPAPVVVILDDFHAVDGSPDVEAILIRVLERAPRQVTFVLAGRNEPSIRLARLAIQGEVARLTTQDLRFSADETADLFAVAFELPLEPDLVGEIDARAEGWVASLQLVYSSIRQRRPSETRAFIRSLSGAEGTLYDYLAEEVLAGLPPRMQHLLVRASLLERVAPHLVLAALSVDPGSPTLPQLTSLLEEAERLGLLGRAAAGAAVRRFHPLLREFLARQLHVETTADQRRAMHAAVARAAESTDWLTACHHFIEASEPAHAMRVIADSAARALGNGDSAAVIGFLDRMPEARAPLVVEAIRARGLLARHGEIAALELLESLDLSDASALERSWVTFARASAYYVLGDVDQLRHSVSELLRNAATTASVRDIAGAWILMLDASTSGSVSTAQFALERLGERQVARGHQYHAAITFHNAMTYALARAQYAEARNLGELALSAFGLAAPGSRELSSTLATLATCAMELGDWDEAWALMGRVTSVSDAHADAYIECAYAACVTGDRIKAGELVAQAQNALRHGSGDPGAVFAMRNTEAMLALGSGDPQRALDRLADDAESSPPDPELQIRRDFVHSIAALVRGDATSAAQIADRALSAAVARGALRYVPRLSLLAATARRDPETAAVAVRQAANAGNLALLELAEVVACAAAFLDPLPQEVVSSVVRWPERWLPVFRRQVERGDLATAHAAARLLAALGTSADIPRVVAFEKEHIPSARARVLGPALIMRTSPRLTIHDLGHMRYEAGDRVLELSQTRRRAASLLAYLITRPLQTATKEQVTEQLWPELKPASALNSLNQTLYFIRRDIDMWYDGATSPNYILNEPELIRLNPDLVKVDSVAFHDAAVGCGAHLVATLGPDILSMYGGRFALEFEYEEWAIGWRERVHALYLNLVHATAHALCRSGDSQRSLQILLQAARIDPESMDLDPTLISVYAQLGATAASAEQYRRFARAHREELGADPPSFGEVLGESQSWGPPA